MPVWHGKKLWNEIKERPLYYDEFLWIFLLIQKILAHYGDDLYLYVLDSRLLVKQQLCDKLFQKDSTDANKESINNKLLLKRNIKNKCTWSKLHLDWGTDVC